jgi:hypothetical protein
MNNICLYTNTYTVGVLSYLVFHFVRHKSRMVCREIEPWCPLYYFKNYCKARHNFDIDCSGTLSNNLIQLAADKNASPQTNLALKELFPL